MADPAVFPADLLSLYCAKSVLFFFFLNKTPHAERMIVRAIPIRRNQFGVHPPSFTPVTFTRLLLSLLLLSSPCTPKLFLILTPVHLQFPLPSPLFFPSLPLSCLLTVLVLTGSSVFMEPVVDCLSILRIRKLSILRLKCCWPSVWFIFLKWFSDM